MTTNLVAKNPATGLYFNGRAFESTKEQALALRPGAKPEDFKLMWQCPVEIEVRREGDQYKEDYLRALREGRDAYHQARLFVTFRKMSGQDTFYVKHQGVEYARKVKVPARTHDSATVRIDGIEYALLLKGATPLSTDV